MLPGKGKKAREGGEPKTAVGNNSSARDHNFNLKLGTLEHFVYSKEAFFQHPNTSKNNSKAELFKSFNADGRSPQVSVKNLLHEQRPLQDPKPIMNFSRIESNHSPQGRKPAQRTPCKIVFQKQSTQVRQQRYPLGTEPGPFLIDDREPYQYEESDF